MHDTPHADVFNNPIKVGDFIIYAASLDWRKGRDYYNWELQKKGSPITLEFTERIVKVHPKSIPIGVRNLLKSKA